MIAFHLSTSFWQAAMSAAQFPLGVNTGIGPNTPASAAKEIVSRSLYTCLRFTRQDSRPSHDGGVTGAEVAGAGAAMVVVVVVDGVLLVTGATFVEADVVVVAVAGAGGVFVFVVESFDGAVVGVGAVVVPLAVVATGHIFPRAPNRTANQTETETTVNTIRDLTIADIFF